MKYLQDDSGNTLTIPVNVLLFKRTVSFITWSIRGDFSTDFSLPNDSEVRQILGYTSINQVATVTNKSFRMMSNGNQIASGKLFIKSVGSQIGLFFISGNTNWINRIVGSLRDVDMSDYDVSINGPNINALKTATDGVIFPVVDWIYNFQKLSNTYCVTKSASQFVAEIYELYPCFYHHTVFERLFETYGLKLDGPLFDDPIYKALIFTPEEIVSDTFISPTSDGNAALATLNGSQSITSGTTALLTISTATVNGGTTFNSADNSVTLSQPYQSMNVSVHVTITGITGPPKTVALIFYKNGIPFKTINFSVTTTGAFVLSSLFDAGAIAVNDKFQLYIKPTGTDIRKVIQITLSYAPHNPGNFIRIQNVMPDIAQIDFVKHVAQRFNCLIDFDDLTQTVTFTPLDSLRLSDAIDISEKITNYTQLPSSGFAARNYLRLDAADELLPFAVNGLNYGDALIESDGEADQDIYQTNIFKPAQTSVNNKQGWLQTYVPLFTPSDNDEGIPYTGVSTSSGTALFTNSTLFSNYGNGTMVRVRSANGTYSGFGIVASSTASGLTILGVLYGGNDTGRIYSQSINYEFCGSRELLVIQNLNVNAFNSGSPIYGDQNIKLYDGSTWPYASAAWAYFTKLGINTVLDNIKTGLNYGAVVDATNISFGDLYNKTLRKIITGRRAEVELLLTETEYNNLVLASYYRIQTKDFSGYFLITDMGGFQDSNTPVTFNVVLTD